VHPGTDPSFFTTGHVEAFSHSGGGADWHLV
jgi:hypothetical protein